MVIDDLNFEGVATFKPKAQAPLVIDADAPLAGSVAFECFEFVAWRNSQFRHIDHAVQCSQFAQRDSFNVDPQLRSLLAYMLA